MSPRHRGSRLAALSGAFALLLVGTSFATTKSITAESGSYKGTTTQTGKTNGTSSFTVSSNHKSVKKFAGSIFADCTRSKQTPRTVHITLTPTPDMAIHQSKFGFHGKFNITSGKTVVARNVSGKISGLFGSSHAASGTMKFSWKFDGNAPSALGGYSCSTGTAHFAASHV